MTQANIVEPVVLMKVNRSYISGMSDEQIYEITRKNWVITPEKRTPQPRYAMAVAHGIIKQVFRIDSWHASVEFPGRMYFTGEVAKEMSGYIGQLVAPDKPGASNPIKYVNC